jgi:hypothetical protein
MMAQYSQDVHRHYAFRDHYCEEEPEATSADAHLMLYEAALDVVLSLLFGLTEIVDDHTPTRSKRTLLTALHRLQDHTHDLQQERGLYLPDLYCRTALLANEIVNVLVEWRILPMDPRAHAVVTDHSQALAGVKADINAVSTSCTCYPSRGGCLALDGLHWCVWYVSLQVSHLQREWRQRYGFPPWVWDEEGTVGEERSERRVVVAISDKVMVKVFEADEVMDM